MENKEIVPAIDTEVIAPEDSGMTMAEARKFKKLLTKFIKSYSAKDALMTDEQWLQERFQEELPKLSDVEAKQWAREAVASIVEYDESLCSINEAAKQGVNKEQWLADRIEKASAGASVVQYGNYLRNVDTALENANAQMMRTVTTNSGEISAALNLDGFIAEQHHVNTFNANAALSKSPYHAEVKVPGPGETYGKNSFDVVIKDTRTGATVHQYQVKYGADAKATIQMLRDHGSVTRYSNQQIVVPAEQVEEVQKAFPGKSVVAEIGGTEKVPVHSDTLTKEQAKELQFKTQQTQDIPQMDWSVFKSKDLALHIGKNAALAGLQGALITTGFSLAAQAIKGEGIDEEEVVETALRTGADAGVKAAAVGAVKVASELNYLRVIPAGTPVGVIANTVCVAVENIKILAKVATGELTLTEALEMMGRTSVAMVYGIGWGAAGAVAGAAALSWIPIVGPVVGGLVGGMLGYMAGSKFGEAVFSGVKAVAKGVVGVCKTAWEGIKSIGRGILSLFGI